MRILVCFSVVPDLDKMSPDDWKTGGLAVDTTYVPTQLNPFDESALELALRLRDRGQAELVALTIADRSADRYLKNLYALRFDHAVRLDCGEDLHFHPEAKAALLASYARRHSFDVVLAGRQNAVGDNGKTPFLLAEMLGLPCIGQVTGVEREGETLMVTAATDGGSVRREVKAPVVLAVGNVTGGYLRVPTLKDKLQYGKREVEVIAVAHDPGSPAARPLRLVKKEQGRQGKVLAGENAREKARLLYELYLKERLERP
ncbi:MAG TPA: electron transfer flavoprotein subunit beta/FixA family protein [Clostridia bacterium]|nr:electron transfer flavoprotein subunit beta/FixA family protein [Clostridia bacterium]